MQPIFIDQFYHEGRGPELIKVHYGYDSKVIVGADYFLANKPKAQENIRHFKLFKSQVFMFTPEEVENYASEFNPWEGESKFALVNFGKSSWLKGFAPNHLTKCNHYRFMFYDEFLDVICEGVEIGFGSYVE